MEFLNAQAKYIGEQLRGMSASQKAAVLLLLVILCGATWMMIRWSSEGVWTELLPQDLSPQEMQQVEAQLVLVGLQTKVEGNRILIRGDENERRRAHAVLLQNNAMPRDTSLGYESLVQDENVFESDQKTQWKQLRGLETELSRVLSRFQGIQDATVLIEVPKQRGFISRGGASSRASVHVTLAGGQTLGKQRVGAIANFVAGAVRGMTPQNVKITDGTRFYRPPDSDEAMPTEHLEMQRKHEEHYAQKIHHQLLYIPGVLVDVHATLRSEDQQIQEKTLGKPVVSKETSETEEMNNSAVATGPGVRPNVGRGTTEGAGGQSSTREKSETTMEGDRDVKSTVTDKRKGYLEHLAASVSVPRSYLARILQEQGSEDSSVAAVEKVAAIELPRIREIIKPLINATEDEQVVVRWYPDLAEEMQPATELAGGLNFIAMTKNYGPQIGLGLLALFSLFMVFRVAKKAQAAIAVSSPAAAAFGGRAGRAGGIGGGLGGLSSMGVGEEVSLESLGGGPVTVGEAQGMEGLLVGHEVDENMVRTQQIAKQISQMVEEDPAGSAAILENWIESAG
ncbi:MAG: flagellar M-ring protein FliF C-terminal domain-containing protein [Planctomycetota bacterium]